MRLLKATGVTLLVLAVALVWTFLPQRLDFEAMSAELLPPANPPPEMRLSLLPTGRMHSQAIFAYRGGSPFDARDFSMSGILVQHPRGDLLFDTGFGRHVVDHAETLPLLMKLTTRYSVGTPIADQFSAHGYEPAQLAGIVLTHAHWDHISGVPDLPGVPVWLDTAEQLFIDGDKPMAQLAHSLLPMPTRTYGFDEKPYLGFARSFDVWGDGSIVLVPAGGHTPGSVIAFLNLPSGKRLALIGDIAWQTEAIEIPAERPWVSRMLVDDDAGAVREQLRHLAAIHQRFPEIQMVPAHDARVAAGLPQFPETTR